MLADVAYEAMAVTRLMDREAMKSEDASLELEAFMRKITMLFVDGHVTEHGFTAWVLEQMRKPLLIYHEGAPKLLGRRDGVLPIVIKRCLGHMWCWVRLCFDVLRAEFPHCFCFLRSVASPCRQRHGARV